MKKILILICGLLTMSAAASAQEPDIDDTAIIKEGIMAPEFTVEMLDGTDIDITDLKGKVVVLNFWATWCPYCVQELACVQAGIIDRFAGKDLVFIAISRGEEKATVEKFVKAKNYTFPVGLDGDESIFKKFATASIPRNIVIDREGKVVLSSRGYSPEIFADMVAFIDGVLK